MGEKAVSVKLPPLEYSDEIDKKTGTKKPWPDVTTTSITKALLLEPPTRHEFEMLAKLHQDRMIRV